MSTLLGKVCEAEQVNREMITLVRKGDADAQLDVLRLRSRFSRLMLEILTERSNDATLSGNSTLASEFDRLFREVRSALSNHQGTWQSLQIERDPQGYRESATKVNDKQVAFYRWCSQSLS